MEKRTKLAGVRKRVIKLWNDEQRKDGMVGTGDPPHEGGEKPRLGRHHVAEGDPQANQGSSAAVGEECGR